METRKRPYPHDELHPNHTQKTYKRLEHDNLLNHQYGWYPNPGHRGFNFPHVNNLTQSSHLEQHVFSATIPEQENRHQATDMVPSEICFGSIIDVKAQIRLPLPLSFNMEPVYTFQVVSQNNVSTVNSPSGERFAVLHKKPCHDLKALLVDGKSLRFQAFISSKEWTRAQQSWSAEGPGISITIDVNIYGQFEHASFVGKSLASNRTYLQQPLYGIEGIRYYNPQYLHTGELLGQQDDGGDQQKEQKERDDTREIHSILDSLSHRKILGRTYTTDRRMKTAPLPHQAEAIDFIEQRETGTIPQDLSLWSPIANDPIHDDNAQTLYQHLITGAKTDRARDALGGIVADDMGLGKTLLMLHTVAASSNRAEGFAKGASMSEGPMTDKIRSKATLVIVPSSLLIDSWLDEIHFHTNPGYLTYHRYHGGGRQEKVYQQQLLEKDIILTTYATVAAEVHRSQNILGRIHWFRIVLDEAHEVRNRTTKQHQAVLSLAAHHRWCLTGTPIQNSVDDLGALVSFLRVPILENPTTFRKFIATPSSGNSKDRFKNLQQLLNSICIRRLRDLLDLPEPTKFTQTIQLSDAERHMYNSMGAQFRRNVDMAISGYGKGSLTSTALKAILELRLFCNNGSNRLSSNSTRDADEILTELQQEDRADCAYPNCMSHVYSINTSNSQDTDGAILIRGCHHLICQSCIPRYQGEQKKCPGCSRGESNQLLTTDETHIPNTNNPAKQTVFNFPSKIERLLEDIVKPPRQKCIVFSLWKKTLDLIGQGLARRNISYCCIHGSLSLSERKRVIDQFRSPLEVTNILLMTLGTGAVGLNLAVASRIYLMEPQWNPAVSEQAIGRCYRLGQTKNVTVIEYITKDTVEDSNVLPRQRAKIRLAGGGFERRKKGIAPERVQAFLETMGYDPQSASAALGGASQGPSGNQFGRQYEAGDQMVIY